VITKGDGSVILRHVITAAAVVASVVLIGLAVFQVLLAAGRPLGRFAWGGHNEVLPARLRVGSVVSICLYAFFAALLLTAAGVLAVLPEGFVRVAVWVLTAYFGLGVVMNAASRSRPERLVMTPVALVLCGACLLVAAG
jgi:predicted Co/Zn/Cd cation transporter (cation efflux family)